MMLKLRVSEADGGDEEFQDIPRPRVYMSLLPDGQPCLWSQIYLDQFAIAFAFAACGRVFALG